MEAELLREIIEKHGLWIKAAIGGERADLSGANLSGAALSCAALSCADLSCADLSCADLSGANLSGANLRYANLSYANLSYANLSSADLSCADLSCADLSSANLRYANLSGAKNLISNINFLEAHFERTEKGYIAYKTFNWRHIAPEKWDIKPGAIIDENVNFTRTQDCGCGINVAPLEWARKNTQGEIWRVLIRWEWLAGICCPYNSDGNIRCERVELLEVVK